MNFEQWLAANGYDATQLTTQQRTHLQAAWKAETSPPVPVAAPVVTPAPAPVAAAPTPYEADLAEARRESARQASINEFCSEHVRANVGFPDRIERFELLRKAAIEAKWDLQKFQLEMLKEKHNVGPIVNVSRSPEITSDILEAALCTSTRLPSVEKVFKEQTLEAAHKAYPHGVSLLEFISIVAKHRGWRGHSAKSDLRNTLRYAFSDGDSFQPRADIGPSTLAISGILSNVANKFVRVAFEAVENAWRGFAAIRPVSDFKEITSYALTGDLTYDQVAPGGEIQHGTLGERSYTNKADTYAKMIGIDRRDLINDDLTALSSVSRRLGRGGALKINDIFWTEWLDDSAFFPTDKSLTNYDDGATDSVLSLAGLENARTIFMQQTDPDGKPLGSMPVILLVPTTLGITARNLMNGLFTASAQSTATVTTENVFKGMFRIVESTYLSNSAYTGYSATAWYLLADPSDLPAIEICFLNGQEMPTIETADMDFDRLGIAFRGYHDFGARLQEYRAGVKLKGAA